MYPHIIGNKRIKSIIKEKSKKIDTYCAPVFALIGWAELAIALVATVVAGSVDIGTTACFQSIPFSTVTAINCPTFT